MGDLSEHPAVQAILHEVRSTPFRWWLYTDGSGVYQGDERVGGAAYVIYDNQHQRSYCGAVAMTHTNVQRAEMEAALAGIAMIRELAGPEVDFVLESQCLDDRIGLVWVGDRANILYGMIRDKDGCYLNARNAEAHLWAQMEYWEKIFRILPIWQDRNTVPAQKRCDRLAGLTRQWAKEWAQKLQQSDT